MKPFVLSLFVLVLFLACSKNSNNGRLPNSVQAIIDENNCVCDPYIKQYTWRTQTVYLLGFTGPGCNWFPGYYDSRGELITMEHGYSLDNFLEEATYIKLIWECK